VKKMAKTIQELNKKWQENPDRYFKFKNGFLVGSMAEPKPKLNLCETISLN
jgi:hypothetical protein